MKLALILVPKPVNRLMRTDLDALATILAEAEDGIGQIIWFLLLPELPGAYQYGLTDSLLTALRMALLVIHRYLLFLEVHHFVSLS